MNALVRRCERLVIEARQRQVKEVLKRGDKTGYGAASDYQGHNLR